MSINCTFPWTGMVINPQGYITVCCAYTDSIPLGHINDIDNLDEFFLEDAYTDLRSKFKDGWKSNPSCVHCVNYSNGPIYHSQSFDIHGGGLQYLELTTSNVCNQTCATCSSMFSSKWSKLNSIFERTTKFTSYSMTNDNINTILKVIPNLKEMQIKGGEPFADMKNLKIINAIADVNPNCRLRICSNMQMIPKAFISSLKRIKNIHLSASVDDIGSRFDWIRGGDFNKVVENMEKLYQEIGVKSYINPCVSIYNVNNLRGIWEYFKEKEFSEFLSIYNIVKYPEIHSPEYMLSQEQIDNTISHQFDDIRLEINVNALYKMKSVLKPSLVGEYNKFTETMNTVRGVNWHDLQ